MDRQDLETELEELSLQVDAALSARQNQEVLRAWFASEAQRLRQGATTQVDRSYVEARLTILVADHRVPT